MACGHVTRVGCARTNPFFRCAIFFIIVFIQVSSGLPEAMQKRPGVKFPVKHVSAMSLINERYKMDDTTTSYSLISSVITLNESVGEYFALFRLGTPSAEVALTIDTGSELVWVQCQPCTQCEGQILDPLFNPANSKTFTNVSCNSPLCNEEPSDGVVLSCGKSDNTCLFKSSYADNSSSDGYLAQDTLTSTATNNATVNFPNFLFGCADYDVGSNLNASGTLGLDRGNHSAVSQLGVQVFSYCLPDRSQKVDIQGFLSFGNETNSQQMQYIKLLQNRALQGADQLYYVNLTGITVGQLFLDPADLQLNLTSGAGGTIIDSGTTLTYLVEDAYTAFTEAFVSQTSGKAVQLPISSTLQTCYILTGDLDIPNVTFHFDASISLSLPLDNIVALVAPDTYCLAFANAGTVEDGAMTIIGNFQQQNILLEFNLESSELGFALTNCSRLATLNGIAPTSTQGTTPASPTGNSSGQSGSSSAEKLQRSNYQIFSLISLLGTLSILI